MATPEICSVPLSRRHLGLTLSVASLATRTAASDMADDKLAADAYDIPSLSVFVPDEEEAPYTLAGTGGYQYDDAASGGGAVHAYDDASGADTGAYDANTAKAAVAYDLAARVEYPTLRRDTRMSLRGRHKPAAAAAAGDSPYALASPQGRTGGSQSSGPVASKSAQLYQLVSTPEVRERGPGGANEY